VLLTRERGAPAAFHARPLPDPVGEEIWVFEADRPALVLGSAQRDGVADARACANAGVEIVRRRSGGGAVLVEPGGVVWFDVVVPAEHLHAAGVGDDVAQSMLWLGWRVAAALADLGVTGLDVHRGGLSGPAAMRQICFAGLGPGEVMIEGRKLVGISQRRTRAGSRFQCAAHIRWSPQALVRLLTAPPAIEELPEVAEIPGAVGASLPEALVTALS